MFLNCENLKNNLAGSRGEETEPQISDHFIADKGQKIPQTDFFSNNFFNKNMTFGGSDYT